MACDMGRLQFAIRAMSGRIERDWRARMRIAGHEVEEPVPEPETDAEFNDQVRNALSLFRRETSEG